MKKLFLLLTVLLILACSGIDKRSDTPTYMADEIVVSYNREARFTTFITKEGDAVTGNVIQKLDNGGKNTWEVENGLAVRQVMYYPNGQIERILEMKNGTEHGSFLMFYSDGGKYVEQHYENGKPVGTWYRWNRDGEIVETIEH